MSLLREIQTSLAQDGTDLGSIFLKLRVLAARLGSTPLEQWIKHESEGYPTDLDVPPYRVLGVTYTGTFLGPFGSGIKNAPIPSVLVGKLAGKCWTDYQIRQGIVEIDQLVEKSADGDGTLSFDASNLILFLQGKIYEDFSCNGIEARISRESLVQIQYIVRMRILDFTLELEKSVPSAAEISFGTTGFPKNSKSDEVTQTINQTIYGDVASIVNSGEGSQIALSIGERDESALIRYLEEAGIAQSDASELARIMASESPNSKEEPFGDKAKEWLLGNLRKAGNGTWKIGVSVATRVLTEAALKFYDFK